MLERATLKGYYTWHFSMQGLPVSSVTSENRGLLPHVFILTFIAKGSYFLWHLLSPVTRCPAIHRCIALCCPDFPTPKRESKTWSVALQRYKTYLLSSFEVEESILRPICKSRCKVSIAVIICFT